MSKVIYVPKRPRRCRSKIVLFDASDTPEYLRYPDILSAYRPPHMNIRTALWTGVASWHNETLNVWTHLIGCFWFIALAIRDRHDITSPGAWPLVVIHCTLPTALGVSAMCHALCCAGGPRVNKFLWALDQIAIVASVFSTYLPFCIWVLHGCYTWLYIAVAFAIATTACNVITLLYPANIRLLFIVMLGAWGIVPVAHGMSLVAYTPYTRPGFQHLKAAVWMNVAQISINLAGVIIFVMHLPERYWPRRFDIIGRSHQWFHVFVTAAMLVYRQSAMEAWAWYSYL